MYWIRRVSLLCLCLLPALWAGPGAAQDLGNPGAGVAFLDDFSGSMALDEGGGSYLLFSKVIGDGIGYQGGYSRIGGRIRLWEDFDQQLFGEAHALITDHSKAGFNIGGGYRIFAGNGLFGVNSWYDNYESTTGNRYQQVTFGGEYLHQWLDLRTNFYVPVGDRENLVGAADFGTVAEFSSNSVGTRGIGLFERAYYGWDIEAGVPFPVVDWLRVYAGTYTVAYGGNDYWGARARAEARVAQGVNVNFQVTEDDKFGTNANLDVELRFGGKLPTKFGSNYSVVSRRYDQVRRQWPIQVHVDREQAFFPFINPDTGSAYNIAWVDNTSAPGGAGTLEDPFRTLPERVNGADLILVRSGVGNTQGAINLNPNQQLLGEGLTHLINTDRQGFVPLPELFDRTGPYPTLVGNQDGQPIITLADNNTVRAFNMSGVTGIAGGTVNDFRLSHLNGNLSNGIAIQNASGLGVIREIDFNLTPGGTGVSVGNTSGPLLQVAFENVATTGGNTGVSLSATGGDVLFMMDNVSGSNHLVTGLQLSASNSNLSGMAENVTYNGLAGNGVTMNLNRGAGTVIFENLTASNNGQDGLRAVADNTSNLNLSILNSTLTGNQDDNVDVDVIDQSIVNLVIDPTVLSNAGEHGLELFADKGATLNALLEDVTINNSGVDAIQALAQQGSTLNLDFRNVTADDSARYGLNLAATGGSTVLGAMNGVAFSDSADSNMRVFASGPNTIVNLGQLQNVTASGLAADGNVTFTARNGAMINSEWTGGGVLNGAADGVVIDVTNAGSGVRTVFNGASISGNNGDGISAQVVQANGVMTGFIAELNNTTVANNQGDGVNATVQGASAGGQVSWSGTTNIASNQGDGLEFNVTNGGSFSATTTAAGGGTLNANTGRGIAGTVSGAGSAALLDLTGTTVSASGSDNVALTAQNNGMIAAQLNNSALLNSSNGAGLRMTATGNSGIATELTGTSINGNAQDGVAFSSLTGSLVTLQGTGGSISGNGIGNGFSGVNGVISGAGSEASVSFNGTAADGNNRHGYGFTVDNAGMLVAEFISTPGQTPTSGSTNGARGLSIEATGAGTNVAVIMQGLNEFNSNGGEGAFISANGIDALAVQVSGLFNNNGQNRTDAKAADGLLLISQNVQATAIEIYADNVDATGAPVNSSFSNNEGDGIDIQLSGTTLTPIGPITTLTRTETIEAFSLTDYTATGNGGRGITIGTDGSTTFTGGSLSNMNVSNNVDDGIYLQLVGATFDSFEIANNTATNNGNNGIHIVLDNTTLNNLSVHDNVATGNGTNGFLLEAKNGSAITGPFPDAGFYLNTFAQNGAAGLALDFDDSALTNVMIRQNTIFSNGGDGILFDFNNSPVTNLVIANNADIVANGGNGINFLMVNGSNINGLLINNNGFGTLAPPAPTSEFQIELNFLGGLTPSQQDVFALAVQRWQSIIIGDLPAVGAIDDIIIDVSGVAIDGVNGILGQAGPTGLRPGTFLPFSGVMEFDSADLASLESSGQLQDVILHEMGHVLGIGTIWQNLGLLSGSGTADPIFTGAQATAAYNTIFGTSANGVPVESFFTAGPGTAEAHWRESVLDNELMTGFLNAGVVNPLSAITVGSMADLGYVIDATQADPYTAPSLTDGGGLVDIHDDHIVIRPTSQVVSLNSLNAYQQSLQAARTGLYALPALRSNGGDGINMSLTDSNLQNATVSNNNVANNSTGDGFRMVDATTQGAPITINFINNQITGNSGGHGINISLNNPETLVSTFSGNNLSENGGAGLNLQLTNGAAGTVDILNNSFARTTRGGAGVDLTLTDATLTTTVLGNSFTGAAANGNLSYGLGGVVQGSVLDIEVRGNTFTGNANAGIGFEIGESDTRPAPGTGTPMQGQSSQVAAVIVENLITSTRVGSNSTYAGEGISLQLSGRESDTGVPPVDPTTTIQPSSVLEGLIAGNIIGSQNSVAGGNAGAGIEIQIRDDAAITDLASIGSTIDKAELTGLTIGAATYDGVDYLGNLIANNGLGGNGDGDGIRFQRDGASFLNNILINANVIENNREDGIDLRGFGAGLEYGVVDVLDFNITGNMINGNGFTSDGTEGLAGRGIQMRAHDAVVMEVNISGNQISGSRLSGIEARTFTDTHNVARIDDSASLGDGADGVIYGVWELNQITGNGFLPVSAARPLAQSFAGHGIALGRIEMVDPDNRAVDGSFVSRIEGYNNGGYLVDTDNDGVGDTLATLTIQDNDISGNALDGLHAYLDKSTFVFSDVTGDFRSSRIDILRNNINDNGEDGLNIHSPAAALAVVNFNNNLVSGNGAQSRVRTLEVAGGNTVNIIGDGIEIVTGSGGQLHFDANQNRIIDNDGRGVNILTSGSPAGTSSEGYLRTNFDSNIISGNTREGFYLVNAPLTNQVITLRQSNVPPVAGAVISGYTQDTWLADFDSNHELFNYGRFTGQFSAGNTPPGVLSPFLDISGVTPNTPRKAPVTDLTFVNNIVTNNGSIQPDADPGDVVPYSTLGGFVMRVGSATEDPSATTPNSESFISTINLGLLTIPTVGGVRARVENNSFYGNVGRDVLIDGFIATEPPNLSTFNDPLIRIDLVFENNRGTSIAVDFFAGYTNTTPTGTPGNVVRPNPPFNPQNGFRDATANNGAFPGFGTRTLRIESSGSAPNGNGTFIGNNLFNTIYSDFTFWQTVPDGTFGDPFPIAP